MKHATLALALAVALAACSGDRREGASAVAGSYSLVRTSEFPLPALVGAQRACRIELTAGSLELTRSAEYRSRFAFQRRCADAAPDSTFEHAAEGAYRVRGDTVELVADDGGTDGTGTLRGDTLELAGPLQTLYYARRGAAPTAATPDTTPSR